MAATRRAGRSRCVICGGVTPWTENAPEKCPDCGARGGMRLVKLTSGSTYDPEGDWQRMLERLARVIKKHGRKLELPGD